MITSQDQDISNLALGNLQATQHALTDTMGTLAISQKNAEANFAESTKEMSIFTADGICVSPPGDAANQGLGLVGKTVKRPDWSTLATLDEESELDTDITETHSNKYPVAIEIHKNQLCSYKRMPLKLKAIKPKSFWVTSIYESSEINNTFNKNLYTKDLVRICMPRKCNITMNPLQNRSRDNDADRYEVHCSSDCHRKSYKDFKTKIRVIIEVCQCYKPIFKDTVRSHRQENPGFNSFFRALLIFLGVLVVSSCPAFFISLFQ